MPFTSIIEFILNVFLYHHFKISITQTLSIEYKILSMNHDFYTPITLAYNYLQSSK